MINIKRKVFEVIEEDISDCLLHKIFEVFIVTLIILNIVVIIFTSDDRSVAALKNFEIFSVIVFTLEYLLRLWTADLKYGNVSRHQARLKLIFSAFGLIDLLSILPFYLELFLPLTIDGRIFRALRLMRLLRILKLSRFLDSFAVIKKVVKSRKYELLITGFIAFIMIMVSSTLMFYLEHDAQPDKFPDIISAFWWAIATLTTIGYGDLYPVTGPGKCVSAIISLVGIGLIALPTGILSSSFLEEFRNMGAIEKATESLDKISDVGAVDRNTTGAASAVSTKNVTDTAKPMGMANPADTADSSDTVDSLGMANPEDTANATIPEGHAALDICPHCGKRLR